MKILLRDSATNACNIGGYKNTPYTGKTPRWHREHQREIGSHGEWNNNLKTEGFLQDLFDLATKEPPQEAAKTAAQSFADALKPHTTKELYSAVCYMLANKVDNADVKEAAKLFIPAKGYATAPRGVNRELFQKYKQDVKEAVVEYCSEDALDILSRINKEYSADRINGEVVYGTILSKVTSHDYDLVDKIDRTYKEYQEAVANQTEEEKANTSEIPSAQVNTIIKELKKSFPAASEEQLINAVQEFVTSEFGVSSIKQILDGGA